MYLSVAAFSARAEDYKVDTPRIGEHELTPEIDLTYSVDRTKDKNAYFGQLYGVNYGVTRYWETALLGQIEKQPGGTMEFSDIRWENIIVPFRPGKYWLDAGLFIGIDKAVDNELTNNFEAKLLLEKEVGAYRNVANIILSHNFGPRAVRGETAGFAWTTTYVIDQYWQPGIEYYADISRISHVPEFNRQSHVVGPILQGEAGPLGYDTGLLVGLTDGAPTATFKLDLTFDF